jgi:cytochrome b561
MTSPATERHPVLVRAFHWASATIIVACAAVVLSREVIEHQPTRQVLIELHRQLGLLVLLCLLGRLITRLRIGMADHSRGAGKIARLAATLAHGAMYGAIACITLLGWALTNAHAGHLRLLEIVPLPNLARADSDLADTLSDWHIFAAWTLLGLIVLHVSAALWHHFRLRDPVLTAMLPGGSPAPCPVSAALVKSPGEADIERSREPGVGLGNGRIQVACRGQ